VQEAYLLLEDGARLCGSAFGAVRETSGEVVFNTGMVGYPETMTDPSYQGQILVCTYPLIGNYGVPGEERENGLLKHFESESIHIQALIVSEYSEQYSHWNAAQSLGEWMRSRNIPGIQGIDTRMLTQKIRKQGSMPGRIVYTADAPYEPVSDPNARNLAAEASIPKPVLYAKSGATVAVVDCGVKNNILQAFLRRGIGVLRVPHDYDALNDDVAGIVFSNGPGDPRQCEATIANCRKAMEANIPVLGICLGSQIIALAAGGNTYKLKYGHRSHNQPVNEAGTNRCYITSQNHGYAIDASTLPEDWREWFVNDNDGTNEGIIHISKPFFGAQFHPEASPGPDDTEFIFDMFVRALR